MKQTVLIIFIIYVAVTSLITLAFYFADKKKAQKGSWRVPEKTLLLLSFLGGTIGGLIAMANFRHKTKHWYFWAVNFLGLIVIAVVLYCILFVIKF